jgi:hypothetical protein
MRVCRRHAKAPAGWNCASCRADLCADCVAKQVGGPKGRPIPVCCTCGRGVAQIMVHRRAAQPFGRRLWRAFEFPLGTTGIISLLFVGFVRALTSYAGAGSFAGTGGFVLRHGLFWAFVFFIIRSVANGERRIGVFDFTDLQSDLVAPAIKGLLATAILWIPAVVYIYFAAGESLMGILTYPSWHDPAVWLLAALGTLYVPMALLAAATDLGFGSILNPIFIGRSIVRIGKDYLLAVVMVGLVLFVLGGAAALLGVVFMKIPVPLVGRWLTFTVGLYGPFVAAGVLGHLLWVHGEVLDWGRSEDFQTPLLPGVEPRGQPRPRPEEHRAPEPAPARAAVPVPAAPPGPPLSVIPLAPALDLPAGSGLAPGPSMLVSQQSLLNLSSGLVVDPPAETGLPPPGSSETPSILKYGIRLPSGVLEAQAFVDPDEPAPGNPAAVNLTATPLAPPAPPVMVSAVKSTLPGPAPAAPGPAKPAPPPPPAAAPMPAKPAAPPPATRAAPVTAIVEARPGQLSLTAAPTIHGFAPALPVATEAPPTVVGHQAVQPPPSSADSEPTKDPPRS